MDSALLSLKTNSQIRDDSFVEQMANWKILNPEKTWMAFAAEYGKDINTIYKLKSTILFKSLLQRRQQEVNEDVDNEVRTKAKKLLTRGLDRALSALNDEDLDPRVALEAIRTGDRILGISERNKRPEGSRPTTLINNGTLQIARELINESRPLGERSSPALQPLQAQSPNPQPDQSLLYNPPVLDSPNAANQEPDAA